MAEESNAEISGGQERALAERIEELSPADGAEVLRKLARTENETAADVAEYLDPASAAAVLSNMDPTLAASVLSDMESTEAAMVLDAMQPDDRVDILAHVADDRHDELVASMEHKEAEDVRNLEQYPPDSAGGIMTTEVTSLLESLTVEEAINELRRLHETLEQMFYVYVVDARNHLVGVLSMRDLILANPKTILSRIMIPNVTSVQVNMDQEQVARLMRKYGYLAMPVVDAQNKLLGIITLDDVVSVLEAEATEDVQRMFGAGAEERLTSPWHFSFKKRVWWLQVNLLTAFMAAAVVGVFEGTIQKLAILAAYMPIVAGMGGNASAQAMAVSIRGIAIGEVDRTMLKRVIWREFLVGLATGVVIGITTALIALLFHWDGGQGLGLGLVIGLALLINHTLACVSGVGIPFVMKWMGFDPAQSATIFATTVTDIVGFFALLGLAAWWLL